MFFLIDTATAVTNSPSILEYLKNEIFTQNICNILGCISFFGTAYLYFRRWISGRKNLEVSIIDYSKPFGRIAQFFISFQNHSSSPITIQTVSIFHNGNEYPCELIPKKIKGKNESLITTPMFPINLAPAQGYLCYLEFLNCEDIPTSDGKTISLKIHTNRGLIEKSIVLGSTAHYLHIVR